MNRKFVLGLLLVVTIVWPSSAWANLIAWTSPNGTLTFQQAVQATFAPIGGSSATSYFFVGAPSTLHPIGNGVVVNFSVGDTIGIETLGSLSYNFSNTGTWLVDYRGFIWANGPATNIHGYTNARNNLAANDPTNSVYWWFDSSQGTSSETTGLISVNAVPEPASLLLLGTGLIGVVRTARRRMRK